MGSYKPKYAKGEVLVHFLDHLHLSDDFARNVVNLAGYKLKDENYEFGDSYIVITKPGEEEAACKELRNLRIMSKDLVDWVTRRDLKLEQRYKDLDEIAELAAELRDEPEKSDADYEQCLDDIIGRAILLKKQK
jgi:hypothetical protein